MRHALLLSLLFLIGAVATPAQALVIPLTGLVLDADFDDKPLGQPIGTGGATEGEPLALGSLTTSVVDTGGGNRALAVSNDLSSTSARRMRFGLVDDQEVTAGPLSIRFTFRAGNRDRFSVLIREALGSARNFMSMSLSESGIIAFSDAAGVAAVNAGSYSADTDHVFELRFDMDAGTYDVLLDDAVILADRAHGIADRGVGALLIGYQASSAGSPFQLDGLQVTAVREIPTLDVVLDAGFDDKPLGEPIAAGGARQGEPVSIGNSLTTEIVDSLPGERALQVNASPQSFVQNIRWQLLDDIEIARGLVVFRIAFRAGALDNYGLQFRESGGSARRFLNLELRSNGDIAALDNNGSLGVIGLYTSGVTHDFEVLFDLDAGTLRVVQDGVALVSDRAFGIDDRGLGTLITGFNNAASGAGGFVLESIRVRASDVRDIPAALAFLQQPGGVAAGVAIAPAVEVGAVNVFDEPVPDGTVVSLARASGPAAVAISNNSAMTEAGAARFSALSLDTPGLYTLRASAALASVESAGFEVVAGPAADLQFVVQPANGTVNVALSPAPGVAVADAFGNPVADGTPVQLAIESGPADAVLGGGSAATSGGTAAFTGLSLDLPGTYTLRASAGGSSALSASFSIALPPGDDIFEDGFELRSD